MFPDLDDASPIAESDDRPTCEEQPFCDRFRQFMDHPELRIESNTYYSIPVDTVKIDATNGKITAELNLASQTDGAAAQKLDLTLSIYQNGILRMLVEEPGHERFRISQEDLPVVEEQLKPADISKTI